MAKKKSRTQQAFELLVNSDAKRARERLKKYSTDLKRLTRDEKTFVRQAQKRAATVRAAGAGAGVGTIAAPGTTTVANRATSRFRASRSSANLAFGAEGVRIGHLRFNQGGRISFSERTFLRSGAFLTAAVGGQIVGNVAEASVRLRDELREGGIEAAGKLATKYAKDNLGRVFQMAGQLFGITKLATAIFALRSGHSWETAERGMTDLGILLLGSEDAVLKRIHERNAEDALMFIAHEGKRQKAIRRVRARDLQRWPQDVQAQMEAVREDLAIEEGDSRLMVRDITNVPLWKRVGLSLNEGS